MAPLDEEKLELIRSWGVGLEEDERDELRAAGKAILMLAEEIDRLNVELWNARAEARSPSAEAVDVGGDAMLGALRARLSRRLHLRSGD